MMRALALVVFAATLAEAAPAFRDITDACGIDFVHANGATGEKQYNEVMGSGACLLDYDGDGRLDVYFVTSVGANRMYRNLGDLQFEDVSDACGADDESYGMGATAADVDNDGDPDLLVTNFGPNRLYRNDAGRFVEITAGIEHAGWGAGAAFLDQDHDGWLDLYIANYVHMATPDSAVCRARGNLRLYCPPRDYPPEQDRFFRSRQDGTYEDATAAAGIEGFVGRGLGVTVSDVDRDGWCDLYVANDLNGNFLFRNSGNGTFEELGVIAGTSHSEDGMEEGGMGVSAEDYDNDGWIDLFVSNYLNETNSLYHNEGNGFFFDESAASGLGASSLPYVGWGTKLVDYDGDGWKDLFITNGHTEDDTEKVDPTSTWWQPDFLFRNRGNGTFEDVTAEAAPFLSDGRAGRGAAFGDLDDDGDPDIIVVNQRDRPRVLENLSEGRHWIGVRTIGKQSNRGGIGARVETYAGDLLSVQEIRAGGSYLCGDDPRALFGIGERTAVDSVIVRWPSGAVNRLERPALDRYHEVVESAS